MSPGDVARGEAAVRGGRGIAVALGGAGVHEGFFAASAKNSFEGLGTVEIIEIAEDDEVKVWFGGQEAVDDFAQDTGFFEAEIGFVGFRDGAAGF